MWNTEKRCGNCSRSFSESAVLFTLLCLGCLAISQIIDDGYAHETGFVDGLEMGNNTKVKNSYRKILSLTS